MGKRKASNPSVKVLSERHYRAGYVVKKEEMTQTGIPPVVVRSAYTPDGKYLGDPSMARLLCSKGIKPELRTPHSAVCSVGFSERHGKWYGWSHRAIHGFDTKAEAVEFAESVS